jgi:hypothetical protein
MTFKHFLLALVLSFSTTTALAQTYPTDTVVTPQNEVELRDLLVREVFGDCGFPNGETIASGAGTFGTWPYTTLLTGAKLFDTGSNRLLIYHGGHNQEATNGDSGGPLIQYALPLGWDVLTINMPTGDHQRFAQDSFPMAAFMRPIALSVNYAVRRKAYTEVVMAGLSGGGWSTVLYSALDTRIKKSVPVAGSWPKYLRYAPGNQNSIGDYEQTLPALSLEYLDLYALAASNQRMQLQVFNSNDPCCFAGNAALDYLDEMQTAATALGGQFGITIVTNSTHSVHSSVFDDIAGSPPPFVPVTAEWNLDESTGNVLTDSGDRFHGSYVNSPTLGVVPLIGDGGTAVAFDGVSDYAVVPDSPPLRPGAMEYAIVLRGKFDSTNYGMAFGKFEMVAPYAGPTVFFNFAGAAPTPGRVQFREKGADGYRVDSIATGLNNNVPHCYVFQRRETSPGSWKLQIHIDGSLNAETTLPAVESLNATGPIYLFSRIDGAQLVRGTFDKAEYHVGKSLTPAEVASACSTPLTP